MTVGLERCAPAFVPHFPRQQRSALRTATFYVSLIDDSTEGSNGMGPKKERGLSNADLLQRLLSKSRHLSQDCILKAADCMPKPAGVLPSVLPASLLASYERGESVKSIATQWTREADKRFTQPSFFGNPDGESLLFDSFRVEQVDAEEPTHQFHRYRILIDIDNLVSNVTLTFAVAPASTLRGFCSAKAHILDALASEKQNTGRLCIAATLNPRIWALTITTAKRCTNQAESYCSV